MIKRLILGIGAALALAACGGTHTVTVVKPPNVAKQVPPLPTCSVKSETLQCILAKQPPPARPLTFSGHAYGVDFTDNSMDATALKRIGAKFVFDYLSYTPSKDWTRGLVNSLHAAGIQTGSVFESSAQRATGGPIAAAEDVRQAVAEGRVIGNTNGPIIFAIDCDCTGTSITPYFQELKRELPLRENAYGGYHQIHYLYYSAPGHPLVGRLNWQTYAWSGSGNCECGPTVWLPAGVAPVEQYLNGNLFDNDRALLPNFGQFGSHPVVDSLRFMDRTRRHLRLGKHVIVASEYRTTHTFRNHGCRLPLHRPTCVYSYQHDLLLYRRLAAVVAHKSKSHRYDDHRLNRLTHLNNQLHHK